MKEKSKSSVSIIGGADGPTSVFLVGRSGKRPLKERIRQYIYKYRRKRIEKRISAGTHTLEEVVSYAECKYGAVEISRNQRRYLESYKNLRESLIIRNKPELLGELRDIQKLDTYNEDTIKEMFCQIELRSEVIANISEHEMHMDFHIYEIKIEDGSMEIEIDYMWDVFGISYSGSKKIMKQFRKIARDIYIYYGVTEEDIRDKSERYSSLLITLTS